MKLLLGSALLLLLTATAPPDWHWVLPPTVTPPPVPADNPMSETKVELGRRLFYDADLSADGTLACASCHEQKRGFADGTPTRPGVHGDPGHRNAPGLANVAWLPRLTYADPSATSLEAQARTPLIGEKPVEMGMKGLEGELTRRLGADACYRRMFRQAFPKQHGRIDIGNISAALAAFERTMIALDSSNDRFARGDRMALSPEALRGRAVFDAAGCATCHSGQNFTDANYHKLEAADARDRGLAEQTAKPEDIGRFRTPSLRNVAITGPWWHDGNVDGLEKAIRRHPTGSVLSNQNMAALLIFLDHLTDHAFLTDSRLSRPDRACGKPL